MISRTPDRREALKLAAGAGLAAIVSARAHAAGGALCATAAQAGLMFGSACQDEVFSDAPYADLLLSQTSIIVPQNQMKFDWLQPREGVFKFGAADALIDWARGRGLMARGHTLFWNDWPPDWLKTLTRRETASAFDAYLDRVVPHFAGRLHSWDVVNEPFYLGKDKPGTFRPGPWYNALGEDYIFRAFRRTAALDPRTKLVLNEAWTERSDPVGLAVRRSLLNLIDRIQDKGLKLDAIGLQGHLTPGEPYDDASFADFLDKIADRKLDIYITEFDIDDRPFLDKVAPRDRDVAARAAAFLDAALAVPAVKMVVTWGLSDRYTWWRDPSIISAYGQDRLPRPLPYDDMLEKKPLWFAMDDAFRKRREITSPG